jgi:hypothetical protein
MIFDTLDLYEEVDKMEKEFSDRILTINFEDLIVETESTIPEVADYLGIRDDQILYKPTFCGQEMSSRSKYLGQINDTWESIMTPSQKFASNLQLQQFNITEFDSYGLSLYIESIIYRSGKKTVNRSNQLIKDIEKIFIK